MLSETFEFLVHADPTALLRLMLSPTLQHLSTGIKSTAEAETTSSNSNAAQDDI